MQGILFVFPLQVLRFLLFPVAFRYPNKPPHNVCLQNTQEKRRDEKKREEKLKRRKEKKRETTFRQYIDLPVGISLGVARSPELPRVAHVFFLLKKGKEKRNNI